MKKITGKYLVVIILAIMTAVSMGSTAIAGVLTFNFDVTFSGDAPAGSSPYLTATFDDSYGGANTVRLTMSASNLTAAENIGKLYFNFNTSLDAASLTFSAVNNTASMPNLVSGSNNGYKADGDGDYDIRFDFPPPPGDQTARFTTGETVIYDITYTSAIDVSSFYTLSQGSVSNGSYYGAAHIQQIDGNGVETKSGWVGAASVVPEPISSALFLVGAATLGFRRFRMTRNG